MRFSAPDNFLNGLTKRWRRQRRRRLVGRAYDMAVEVARLVPRHTRLLDVGCGNGFIAHHLSALLEEPVVGIDLGFTTAAPIEYIPFDGCHFPVEDAVFDGVLLCYVLHHTQDLLQIMKEVRRVLRYNGLCIVYEDVPQSLWDRAVCWTHDRRWRSRTGPCTFYRQKHWKTLFEKTGFEVLSERPLSRWRNLAHPVSRRFYLLRSNVNSGAYAGENCVISPGLRNILLTSPR